MIASYKYIILNYIPILKLRSGFYRRLVSDFVRGVKEEDCRF